MEERQGTESNWIPKTPWKLTRAAQKSNSQTPQLDTGNFSHLGNSNCIQKKIQAQNAGESCNQKDSVACNPSGINNDSRFYLDLWNRGMAHLINCDLATTAQTAAQSSSCASASINHVKCASSRAESSDSSSTFKGLFPESVLQCASETYQTKGTELNASIMYHTAPSTPNLTNIVDKSKGLDEQDYQVDVEAKENKESALNKIPIESSELQKEGQSELVVDISCSNVSKTMVVENHEPDTGSFQNIDMKTPQQRPRKKKHRPKVVIDGKPKQKPRNTTTTATPASSEKINTPKRKYVRRKNVGTEAETPKEDIIQSDLGSEVKTLAKRKYTRVKKVNDPTMTPPEEVVSGTSSPKYNQTAKRPRKRSLNFDSDSQIDCEKSSSVQMPLTENQMTSSALKPEEKVEINIAQYNLQSMGKEFEDYLLSKGVKTVDFSPPTEIDQLYNKSMVGNTNDYYNKVANFLNSRTQKEMGATDVQYTSNYSSILTQETYGSPKKRQWPSSAGPSDSHSIYSSAQSNYYQDFSQVPLSKEHRQEISFQHFQETFMKKKTKQAHKPTDYTMMSAIASADRHMQNYVTTIVNNCREACSFGMMKVNRSANSGPSRISKVHSSKLMPMRNAEQITMEQSNGLRHSDLLSCFTPRTKLQCILSVDDIIKQFKRLDISPKRNARPSRKKRALISDPYRYSGNNALVVYQRDQSMIPFIGSSNRSKRRGPRPKVDLDEETARVWTLLLENIDSQGIDGTDEEKRRYWEKEREVFGGRVESFVAKMRLLQGDRRFRPWKGSVVDSVIGVFLTQNVSDHLSSSAFMSMASKFPLEPKSDNTSSSEGISEMHNLYHSEYILGDVFRLKNYQELVRNISEGTESTVSSECGQTVMLDNDLRASDNILSSQTSVVSPQNSTDSIVNKKELSSHMFLEEESTSVCFQNTSSFVELLQMQEQRVLESPLERDVDQSGLSEESGAGPSSQNSIGICSEQTVQNHTNLESKHVKLDAYNYKTSLETTNGVNPDKPKTGKILKEPEPEVDWDSFRIQAEAKCKRERSSDTMDSVNWERVRCTEVRDIAEVIKERGMNNRLAGRIKDFLNRLIREHGSLDLEWLRDIPPDKAKEYLLSVKGLGLKSVECVRLLTLHHLAFPVDTNVGRIAVRLGWVPLQPLPESLQLHLLELYPVLESIQKHLWPRLCKLDQRELYELHYHMITFGKVFCTKSKPNCNACPMRAECRHFASAYASARLALPAPQDKSIVNTPALQQRTAHESFAEKVDLLQLPIPESTENLGPTSLLQFSLPTFQASQTPNPIIEEPKTPEPEPIVEEPKTPEPETIVAEPQISDSEAEMEKETVTEPRWTQSTVDMEKETVTEPQWTQSTVDMEDIYKENDDEIPTIDLNLEALNQNLQSIMRDVGLQDSEYSKALVVLTPAAAAIPMPKLKNINRLRTEHQVYLLPDSHQLLKGLEKREENDPSPYLLAIWAPGETINSIQPPERKCSSEGLGQLCYDDTCFSCNSIREATSHTVRGTILIPCRTAMRGSFPLNGTYFQVNEVFADHETSLNPIDIPRDWLWNLRRRTVYFGTSIPSIFKGLGDLEIQYCFWKGFVCVRGFDRETRGPRPLIARLHFPVSRMPKNNKEGVGGGAGTGLAKDASDETRVSKQMAL